MELDAVDASMSRYSLEIPQWWQTWAVLGLLGFLDGVLGANLDFSLSKKQLGLICPITSQWWNVCTNLSPLAFLGLDQNKGIGTCDSSKDFLPLSILEHNLFLFYDSS